MSPKAQGLVSNTHHGKKHMLKNCAHDRMSVGKAAKRSNSGATAKKTTFSLHPTKMECCIDKDPNEGLLFEPNTG